MEAVSSEAPFAKSSRANEPEDEEWIFASSKVRDVRREERASRRSKAMHERSTRRRNERNH